MSEQTKELKEVASKTDNEALKKSISEKTKILDGNKEVKK